MLIKLKNISTTTIDVPGHAMVLKPGATMWADSLTGDLQAAIENGFLEIIDQVSPGSELPDGSVTPSKLSAALLERFVVVVWGEPEIIDPNSQRVAIQLQDLAGNDVAAEHALRITCDERASMEVGDHGDALTGNATCDLIACTDSAGRLDLVVTCDQSITVSIAAGPTQASPLLDCRTGCDITFT